jgi:hypothetical protein
LSEEEEIAERELASSSRGDRCPRRNASTSEHASSIHGAAVMSVIMPLGFGEFSPLRCDG